MPWCICGSQKVTGKRVGFLRLPFIAEGTCCVPWLLGWHETSSNHSTEGTNDRPKKGYHQDLTWWTEFYWMGYFQEYEWEVTHSSRNDSKTALSTKGHPCMGSHSWKWETWSGLDNLQAAGQVGTFGPSPSFGLRASTRLSWSTFARQLGWSESVFQASLGLLYARGGRAWRISGTSWSYWVVYFLCLISIPAECNVSPPSEHPAVHPAFLQDGRF